MTGGLSARSTSGQDEGRPRWGDRGVATGRLWEPTAPNERLPQVFLNNKVIKNISMYDANRSAGAEVQVLTRQVVGTTPTRGD